MWIKYFSVIFVLTMKKAFSAILLVLYISLSSGVVINRHYCMNRFDSADLGGSKSEVCGKCGMHTEDSNGCCHDELKIVKLQDDQQSSSAIYHFNVPVQIVHSTESVLNDNLYATTSLRVFHNHSPPLAGFDICLRNCVFRI